MRTTLHDLAPNTYYGQWLAKNARKRAAKQGAIARNETVASRGVAPFDGAERGFRRNRSPARWKFSVGQKEKSARQAKCAFSDDHAAHRFDLQPFGRSACRCPRTSFCVPIR
jgi:hypothetical protein